MKLKLWSLAVLVLISVACFGTAGHESVVERMPNLVMQLGILILAARLGAVGVQKIGIPGVLGELLIGVLIGPYLLGGIPLPGFEFGLFSTGEPGFPIHLELYGIAIIASIILLFLSGLETDLSLLIRFSLAGMVVGLGGIIFSFLFGSFTAMYFLKVPFMDPKCLFLGIMSTATSVGITARILSEQRKMDTPEGVTILAGAVIDDVLGVILLAIILGISAAVKSGAGTALNWGKIGMIAFKEIGIWLGFSITGLYFAKRIGGFLKQLENRIVFSIIAFSFALIIAGLFERAGLAMIIGAYVVGVSLSKTDISVSIQEALHPLKLFFVPVFFTVMGMLVDVRALFSTSTLIFGLVYTIGAILAKYLGCGVPALALGFNFRGARRIGLGMIPRGEVALIIASIGLSYGFLADPNFNIFGIAVFMTLITTTIAPPLLNYELKSPLKGVKDSILMPVKETLEYHLEDDDLAEMLSHKISQQFVSMGFFVNHLESDIHSYHIRRHDTTVTMSQKGGSITLLTEPETAIFVQRMIHEAVLELKQSVQSVLDTEHLSGIGEISDSEIGDLARIIQTDLVIPHIESDSKEGVVWAMLKRLNEQGIIPEYKNIYYDLLETWDTLSPGLINAVAIPHLHTNAVSRLTIVCGITRQGVDFGAIDRKRSRLVFLVLTPLHEANTHIKVLSLVSRLCRQPDKVTDIVNCDNAECIRRKILESVKTNYKTKPSHNPKTE
jgi:Kef-type K+ transport system membrane component KefB/mannitol/fructose-specific phosphotransferase system IIA component (Ntr-type)